MEASCISSQSAVHVMASPVGGGSTPVSAFHHPWEAPLKAAAGHVRAANPAAAAAGPQLTSRPLDAVLGPPQALDMPMRLPPVNIHVAAIAIPAHPGVMQGQEAVAPLQHQLQPHNGRGGVQYDDREDNDVARQHERELEQELHAYAAQQFAEAQQQQYMQMQIQQFGGVQHHQQQPQVAGWDPPAAPAALYANQTFGVVPPVPPAVGPGHDSSKVICIAEHCPPPLWKPHWSLDAFDVRAKLYEGGISSVWRAVDRRSGITVALKAYKRAALSEMERHQVAREIWLHAQLVHPAIIAMYAAWKDREHVWMVLEWADEGNVWGFMASMGGVVDERTAVPLVLEPALSALAYVHAKSMIHRDIKPENILITSSLQVKIADFGLSIHQGYEVANTRLGTMDYLAPEILDCPVKSRPFDYKGVPTAVHYTAKVDCWSVGVLAYELLTGASPFQAPTPAETLARIRSAPIHIPDHLSPGARDFVARALTRDPAARPTMQELLDHPWISSLCTQRVLAALPQNSPLQRRPRWSDDGRAVGLPGGASPGPQLPATAAGAAPVPPAVDSPTARAVPAGAAADGDAAGGLQHMQGGSLNANTAVQAQQPAGSSGVVAGGAGPNSLLEAGASAAHHQQHQDAQGDGRLPASRQGSAMAINASSQHGQTPLSSAVRASQAPSFSLLSGPQRTGSLLHASLGRLNVGKPGAPGTPHHQRHMSSPGSDLMQLLLHQEGRQQELLGWGPERQALQGSTFWSGPPAARPPAVEEAQHPDSHGASQPAITSPKQLASEQQQQDAAGAAPGAGDSMNEACPMCITPAKETHHGQDPGTLTGEAGTTAQGAAWQPSPAGSAMKVDQHTQLLSSHGRAVQQPHADVGSHRFRRVGISATLSAVNPLDVIMALDGKTAAGEAPLLSLCTGVAGTSAPHLLHSFEPGAAQVRQRSFRSRQQAYERMLQQEGGAVNRAHAQRSPLPFARSRTQEGQVLGLSAEHPSSSLDYPERGVMGFGYTAHATAAAAHVGPPAVASAPPSFGEAAGVSCLEGFGLRSSAEALQCSEGSLPPHDE